MTQPTNHQLAEAVQKELCAETREQDEMTIKTIDALNAWNREKYARDSRSVPTDFEVRMPIIAGYPASTRYGYFEATLPFWCTPSQSNPETHQLQPDLPAGACELAELRSALPHLQDWELDLVWFVEQQARRLRDYLDLHLENLSVVDNRLRALGDRS